MPVIISVLLSVHNGEKYLSKAITSVLKQNFVDFEFIIVDDASTDNSAQIITDFKIQDKRIKIITNKQNLGLTKSLNLGLLSCVGKYIARIDADDLSEPDRLEKQFDFMEKKDF